MSAPSAAAQDEDGDRIKELQERLQDALAAVHVGEECIMKLSAERVRVRAAVRRLHSAKGRQQKQQALYDLFDLIGL